MDAFLSKLYSVNCIGFERFIATCQTCACEKKNPDISSSQNGNLLSWNYFVSFAHYEGNITCVNLAAVGTFMARGIRPNKWYEKERAKKATRVSLAIWGLVLAGTLLLIWYLDFELPTRTGSPVTGE